MPPPCSTLLQSHLNGFAEKFRRQNWLVEEKVFLFLLDVRQVHKEMSLCFIKRDVTCSGLVGRDGAFNVDASPIER